MKRCIAGHCLIALLFAGSFSASRSQGQTLFYVRADATGASNGSDWSNAYTSLPATLVRGATYYIADGSYPFYTFDDGESGTSVITIRKATVADHGTDTGWQGSYGDGIATFTGSLTFQRDYYVIDGVLRNENNWNAPDSYGFRITGHLQDWPLNFPPGGDHITVQYCDIGGAYSEDFVPGMPAAGGADLFGPGLTDLTIRRCYIHNVKVGIHIISVDNFLIEYNYMGPGWGKEGIRGNGYCRNGVIRYNLMRNASQRDPTDPTSGTTADIGIWSTDVPNAYQNLEIYGNVIWNTLDTINHTDAAILVGGNGVQWVGVPADNVVVYNNTFAGLKGAAVIRINGGTGNRAYNNLWYQLVSSTTGALGNGLSAGNNITLSSDPFVNFAGGNFRLAAGAAPINQGSPQGSPYNIDIDGNIRGQDGTWDIGAFEFASGVSDTTPPVIGNVNASAIASTSATITWTTDENATSAVDHGLTASYGSTTAATGLAATHSVILSGLTGNTAYHFRVRSTDGAGNEAVSGDFTFQTIAPDTIPPSVTLVSPLAGSTLANQVTLTAAASDNVGGSGLAGVQFFVDSSLIGNGTTSDSTTYTLSWNTRTVPNGAHLLKAVASDAEGNEGSSTQINVTVQNALPDLRTGLVGYWRFDESSGTVAADSSGNINHGTLINGAGHATGRYRNAVLLDGVNDRVELGTFSVSGNQLTLSAWIYPTGIGADPRILTKAPSTSDEVWMLEVDNGAPNRLGVRLDAGGSRIRLTGGTVALNEWTHVVGVFNGTTLRLYRNGVEVASQSVAGNVRVGTEPVWVGDSPPGSARQFQGSIDEVRIYERALTPTEVAALHAATVPNPPTGLTVQQTQ